MYKKRGYSNHNLLKYPMKIKNRSSFQKTYRFQKMCQCYVTQSIDAPECYATIKMILELPRNYFK